jgi:Transposase domain (DUF772)
LQAFYSVRSERQLMEQINYNLLFRWFVGLGVDTFPVLQRTQVSRQTVETGHSRRFRDVRAMSAYPPTPDVLLRCRELSKRAIHVVSTMSA